MSNLFWLEFIWGALGKTSQFLLGGRPPLYRLIIFRTSFLFTLLFRSYHFLFLVTFGDEVTKIISNLCLHFARQDRQDGENGKKITQLKWPKYQKPKDEHMGWAKQCRKKKTQKKIFTITSRGFVSGLTRYYSLEPT